MTAESGEVLGAGGERFKEIEAAVAAAGALAVLAVQADDDRRERILLGKP